MAILVLALAVLLGSVWLFVPILFGPGMGADRLASWRTSLLVDGALLTLFALQHSGMARRSFKEALARIVPPRHERALYVLASALVLALMAWQWRAPPNELWKVHSLPAQIAIHAVALAGMALVVATFRASELGGFLGWRPALPDEPLGPLRTHGVYGVVRHPMIWGTALMLVACPTMTAGRALLAGGWIGYAVLAAPWEERDLRRIYGEAYALYAQRVPRWLPRWRRAPGPRVGSRPG